MDLESNNYTLEYDMLEKSQSLTKTGIYYVEATLEAFKVIQVIKITNKKITESVSKQSSKIVFSFREENRNIRKLLENNPSITTNLNKKYPNKNLLIITFKIIKYLGEIQQPTKEWEQKSTISKENIKTTSILLPSITSSVSTSSHRSMSLDDL